MASSAVSSTIVVMLVWFVQPVRSLFPAVGVLMLWATDITCSTLCAPTACVSLAPAPLRSASESRTATRASANSSAKMTVHPF